jgi:hypothetical protein
MRALRFAIALEMAGALVVAIGLAGAVLKLDDLLYLIARFAP